jgi:hypothetical protein
MANGNKQPNIYGFVNCQDKLLILDLNDFNINVKVDVMVLWMKYGFTSETARFRSWKRIC